MENHRIAEIYSKFDTGDEYVQGAPYGDGHINDTFLIEGKCNTYTLQRINTSVFREPDHVMHNIRMVTEHLAKKIKAAGGDVMRETLNIIRTTDGNTYYYNSQFGFYRLFYFITDAKTYQVVEKPEHFYNAAKAFGKFQNMLSDFPAKDLYETIPNFHNTESRFNDFLEALSSNRANRRGAAEAEIDFVMARRGECALIVNAIKDGSVPMRVTHNDTKYDNILIDNTTGEGVCIIDLDTVMPGSVLYDYGDSLRFGANNGDEDDLDLGRVFCRMDLFEEFTRGYIEELGASMTEREFELMPAAAKLITFECGMRFLTDYLNGDTYFKIHRPNHNYDRARAQFKLVSDMESKSEQMREIVEKLRRNNCHD